MKTLNPRQVGVQIGDRQFWLREFTLAELQEFLDKISSLPGLASSLLGDDPQANLSQAVAALNRASEDLILWVLRDPYDNLPPPDQGWLRSNLTPTIQRELLDEVYTLNNLGQLLGEVGRLLEARAVQQAQNGKTS